jgi:hypothetical protein
MNDLKNKTALQWWHLFLMVLAIPFGLAGLLVGSFCGAAKYGFKEMYEEWAD